MKSDVNNPDTILCILSDRSVFAAVTIKKNIIDY